MKKRILAILLSLCLFVGLLPTMALAAENREITTPLDFSNVGDGDGQTPSSGSGYSWSGDAKNGYTLELNGLDLKTPTNEAVLYAITLPEGDSEINIIVKGMNQINAPDCTSGSVSGIYRGDKGNGKVKITGEGTLTINATGCAFVTSTDLEIKDVTLNATCTQGGIQVNKGNLSISNSTIKLNSDGLSAVAVNAVEGAATIENSMLNITTGKINGLYGGKTLTISGGIVTVTNNDGESNPTILGGDVVIKNGAKVTAVNKCTDSEQTSYALGSFNSLTLEDSVQVSASAYTSSIAALGDFSMAATATLILPEGTTAEQLTSMKVPATDNLLIGTLPAKWRNNTLTFALTSISITTPPSKTSYTFGEPFDPTGMVVIATYEDKSTKDITNNIDFSNVALKVGQTSVNLSYTEDDVTKTCVVSGITVNKKTGKQYALDSTVAAYNDQAQQTVDLSKAIPDDSGTVKNIGVSISSGNDVIASVSGDAKAKAVYYTLEKLTEGGQSATLTATITTENYTDITVTINIKVLNGAPVLSPSTITYGEKLSTITLSGSMMDGTLNIPGTFVWDAPDTIPNAGDYLAAWTFTPNDYPSHQIVKGAASIKVNKATPTGVPKYTAISSSGKTLADAGLTTEGGTFSVPGTVTWNLADTTAVEANTSYEWVFTPTDSNNYNTLTGSIELWHQSSGGGSSASYTITVNEAAGGTVKVSPTRASKGNTVTITVTPNSGYELDELTVTDKNGDTVKLTDKGDGKYTFKMPASKVTVEATFVEIGTEPETLPFTDVSTSAYYYDAVAWAVENGITEGTSATTFSPDMVCTRAQMVTFLWRAAGSPKPTTTNNPFTDVQSSAYYYEAVLWAVEQGITNGTSATTFSPDATCTRAQTVTFLWRSNSAPVVSGSSFADVPADAYYANAVAWAVSEGVTNGTSATTFSPDATCTRAQIVTFLWRDAQ